MRLREILPRWNAGDGLASSPMRGAGQGLGHDLIAYTNADIEATDRLGGLLRSCERAT